jgi:hypothetical protein
MRDAQLRLSQPSRMVVFVSHGSLQGLLFGRTTTPSPAIEWVSNYAMERVLERMITNTGCKPPVEVAIFTACHLAERESWRRLTARHPELRVICYDNTVLKTVGHPMLIAVSLMLWFSGDEKNIAPIIKWSNARGYGSPIHGIWKHSFLPGKPRLVNEEHAWIFNPDGILANMSRYNHMFLTDKYKDASPMERYSFLTRDVGPMQVINMRVTNVTPTALDDPWSSPRNYTPHTQRYASTMTYHPYSTSASVFFGWADAEPFLAATMPLTDHPDPWSDAAALDWQCSSLLPHHHLCPYPSMQRVYKDRWKPGWRRLQIDFAAFWTEYPMHAWKGYGPE